MNSHDARIEFFLRLPVVCQKMGPMQTLADVVLPMTRTRADLHRLGPANAYGVVLREAVTLLEQAAGRQSSTDVYSVTQRAIASAVKVIRRADDSSGIIGDAIKDLLALHANLAEAAAPPPAKLVDWMITFQFHGDVDYFTIDPAAYGPALGEQGMVRYRAELAQIADRLAPPPTEDEERAAWQNQLTDRSGWERRAEDRHARFVLDWNAQRLAVWDRDVEAIIATHIGDGRVAARLHDAAKALAEIGEFDASIDWAKRAVDVDRGHQSAAAARYWCSLVAEHRSREEALAARRFVFDRWPTAANATALYHASGERWSDYRDEVTAALEQRPTEAVSFALRGLDDVHRAWELAHALGMTDLGLWDDLATRYETIDPIAVLPVHTTRVLADLDHADVRRYRAAARRLARMQILVRGTVHEAEVRELVAALRDEHRRRPRLQQEFTRAGLP